jgi:hypothetical protein
MILKIAPAMPAGKTSIHRQFPDSTGLMTAQQRLFEAMSVSSTFPLLAL